MLGQTGRSSPKSTLRKFLNHKGQEGNGKDDHDRNDTTLDPVDDGNKLVAADGSTGIGDRSASPELAKRDFMNDGAEVDQNQHEKLHREDNEQVVDVETWMCVVEGQETIQR